MPAPTWTAGQVLAAADVNSWFVGLYAVKTADQSITSSTTLTNDTALFLSVAASATYLLHGFLLYEGGTSGSSDIKWTFTMPAGAALRYSYVATPPTITTAAVVASTAASAATGASTGGPGVLESVMMLGTVVTGVTAGTLQLQWAQNTSSLTSTIMHAQSCLALWRVS